MRSYESNGLLCCPAECLGTGENRDAKNGLFVYWVLGCVDDKGHFASMYKKWHHIAPTYSYSKHTRMGVKLKTLFRYI